MEEYLHLKELQDMLEAALLKPKTHHWHRIK